MANPVMQGRWVVEDDHAQEVVELEKYTIVASPHRDHSLVRGNDGRKVLSKEYLKPIAAGGSEDTGIHWEDGQQTAASGASGASDAADDSGAGAGTGIGGALAVPTHFDALHRCFNNDGADGKKRRKFCFVGDSHTRLLILKVMRRYYKLQAEATDGAGDGNFAYQKYFECVKKFGWEHGVDRCKIDDDGGRFRVSECPGIVLGQRVCEMILTA
jgi:hypothetical protein